MPWSPPAPAATVTGAKLELDAHLRRRPARLGLIVAPSPVQRLATREPWARDLWVKRDDLCAPVYGGSKARKLDFVLAEARYRDAESILGIGARGSHQLVALAIYLAKRRPQLSALCFDQVSDENVERNFATLEVSRAKLFTCDRRRALPSAWLRQHRVALRSKARPAVYLSPGASTPMGCLGLVNAALEFAAQVRRGECPQPRTVYVTGGSAGTAAGLAVGFAMAEMPVELRVVSAVERWALNPIALTYKISSVVQALRAHEAHHLPRRLGVSAWLRARGVRPTIDHSAVGSGYGRPTPASRRAVSQSADFGLRLEATYTGKCWAAMRAQLATPRHDGPTLFWNTHASQDPLVALQSGCA